MTGSPSSFYPVLYLLVPVAYIIGSIPFGVLVTRKKGIDLRTVGSGNIGTTNVLRTAGKVPAILTLLGDFLKGSVAVILCRFVLAGINQTPEFGELWEGIIGITAVLGHMYPVFLSFKGGKGIATGFGVLAVYSPFSALILFLIWISIAVYTRYSSLAAIMAFIALPIVFVMVDASRVKISIAILLAFLIILKHKSNIKRLIEGTEAKIGH